MVKPEWGIWFILIALLPLVLRVFVGGFQFKPIDSLVVIFVATAWVGYWAAYDQVTAWSKVWLIVIAALLYFSLMWQPKQNLFHISIFLFYFGVGVSLYFFLTHDFVTLPRKLEYVNRIGRWIMDTRPQTGWKPIHPNYIAGMIAITVPFIIYPSLDFRKKNAKIPEWFLLTISIGLGVAGLALVMATSRGVVLAIVSGVGTWFLWRLSNLIRIRYRFKSKALFTILFSIYLCLVVVFLFLGPAQWGSIISDGKYGNGSRAELFERSVYLVLDYPITGGGLGSFPGLYSQYILNIPFFFLPNSHNLFLDIAIEQGVFGGLSYLILYLFSLLVVSDAIVNEHEDRTFKWIVLYSLIVAFVHGMVDDYLYNGAGTVLSLFLIGLAMNGQRRNTVTRENSIDLWTIGAIAVIWMLIVLINLNQIRAVWYANIGAVQLAKAELYDFPNAGWAGDEIIPKLSAADASLRSSLQFDHANRTANQRLGMIYMLKRDFQLAEIYLEGALKQTAGHRGIIKSLGYCYVWLGETEKAQPFLLQIPETREELDAYTWWWETQGRIDLSENATQASALLNATISQP